MDDQREMFRCDDCGDVFDETKLRHPFPDVPDLMERVDVGGEVPAGECPCGALAYRCGPEEASCLVLGNMSIGYEIVGPFESHDAASTWDDDHRDGTGWVMQLTRPTSPLAQPLAMRLIDALRSPFVGCTPEPLRDILTDGGLCVSFTTSQDNLMRCMLRLGQHFLGGSDAAFMRCHQMPARIDGTDVTVYWPGMEWPIRESFDAAMTRLVTPDQPKAQQVIDVLVPPPPATSSSQESWEFGALIRERLMADFPGCCCTVVVATGVPASFVASGFRDDEKEDVESAVMQHVGVTFDMWCAGERAKEKL